MRFAPADRVTAAHQWWKNGDHPNDQSETTPEGNLTEGKVVRFYRSPDVTGTDIHPDCGAAYDAHGFIETGEQLCCPGSWVVGKAQYRVVRANMYGLSYEPETPGMIRDVPVDVIADCRGCDLRLVNGARSEIETHRTDTGHVVDIYEVEQADQGAPDTVITPEDIAEPTSSTEQRAGAKAATTAKKASAANKDTAEDQTAPA